MGILKIGRKGERTGAPTISTEELAIVSLPQDQLGISASAASHIARLLVKKGDDALYLRVAIRGGGCSGLSIHYEFCSATTDKDVIFSAGQARVCIDKKSLSILGGATLHAREYLGTYEFVLINNPAEKQCSCGKSFSL